MKITKHSVFTTVVSGRSYGKIRDAPKTRNLPKCLKYSEAERILLSYFGKNFPLISAATPVLRPSLLEPHFNKTLSAISPHRQQKVFRKQEIFPKALN